MRDYTGAQVFSYGADDPMVTAHLFDLFYTILNLEGTWEFVRDYEFPMAYVLSDAYLAGVSIDYVEVERQRAEDKLTFDTNLVKIRALLRENCTAETSYAGACNWMQELLLNHQGEAKYLKALITKTGNSPDLRTNKVVMKWVGPSVTPAATTQEILTAVSEKLSKDSIKGEALSGTRAPLWKAAVEAATYAEFVETKKDASFSWTVGKINQLSESFGLANWPDLIEVGEHLKTIGLSVTTAPQREFIRAVVDTAKAAETKKHTTTDSYRWLKAEYLRRFDGGSEKAGKELNLDSPKQAAELLYALLGLPIEVRSMEVTKPRLLRGATRLTTNR